MSQPKRYRPMMVSKDKVEMQQCISGDWTSLSEYYLLHDRLNEAKAKNDAIVQQGIRDHGDWRSKLNFLEADYKAEIARLTAENERLKAEVEWLRKADRLVCWNPTTQQWEVRHEAPK